MNIIFVSIAYPRTSNESNLYSDLMDEFSIHGHKVYVVCSIEKRFDIATNLTESNGIKVLRVQTGNITSNPNYIAKGLALLQLQSQFIHAINKYFEKITFDLILYSTPPIQYNRIIKYFKKQSHAKTYLLLKDIFPQNAIDIGLFSKWNPVYWYFRKQEKTTYQLSDRIGCMSPANVSYLLKHNPKLSPDKVDVCTNSLKERGRINEQKKNSIRTKIRLSLSIGEDELLLVYGGNLGISQGLSYLIDIIKAYSNSPKVRFLIAGKGTWFNRIEKFVIEGNHKNVIILNHVPSVEFKEMLIASDIGLIFLNPQFTIPNFPSRLTSYLEIGLPVIACTDTATDIGEIIEEAGCGFKVISGDLEQFQSAVSSSIDTPQLLSQKSANARALFESLFTTEGTYSTIMRHLN